MKPMRPKSVFRTIVEPLGIAIALAAVVRGAIHLYVIPSRSMAPTLEVGDEIVVTRYFASNPERGHVVVFRSPADSRELIVKRIVGLPGDLVDSRLGRVRVGGYTLAEPYLLQQAMSGAIQTQLVPRDSYFVLGDNRDDSLDSRSWGVVPRDRIVGRARLVLWSSTIAGGEAAASASSARPDVREPATGRTRRVFKWIE